MVVTVTQVGIDVDAGTGWGGTQTAAVPGTSPVELAEDSLGAAIARWAADLPDVDPDRVARKTFAGLPAGATADQAAELAVQCAAELIGEEPQYSKLAARLLSAVITAEAASQGAVSFSAAIAVGHREGLIGDVTAAFVEADAARFDAAIDTDGDLRFEYFGLRTVYDRYLLRHPVTRRVIETPQHFLMRVAAGLSQEADEAVGFYRLMSSLAYLPSSPTLFNSGTRHTQMSSCYLVDS
ncbi:MAG: ribonucleoside-diphosphate reductase subunit alpha, partial [Catenulispora sp.]|nr:ribonucleoside-diphosphate reductase subunit alpha [Catenulispora sp.]